MKKIGDLFDIKAGCIMSRVLETDEKAEAVSLPVLSPKNMALMNAGEEDVRYERIKLVYYNKLKEDGLLKEGDIVVSLVNPYHSMLVPKKLSGGMVSSFCAVLRAKDPHEICVDYFQKMLYWDSYRGENGIFHACLNDQLRATAAISLKKLSDTEVEVPTMEEQMRKASVFLDIQKRIQLLKAMIEAEKELAGVLIEGAERKDALVQLTELYKDLRKEYGKWTGNIS
jgi:hypothetical protein